MRYVPWATLGLPALVYSDGLEGAVMMRVRGWGPGEHRCCGQNVCPPPHSYIETLTPNMIGR